MRQTDAHLLEKKDDQLTKNPVKEKTVNLFRIVVNGLIIVLRKYLNQKKN